MSRKKKKPTQRRKNLTDATYDQLQKISDLIESGDFDQAHDLLEPLEKKFPANDEIWEERAHFYWAIGDINEAWWSSYRALQLDPYNMQVLTNLMYLSAEAHLSWATLYYFERYEENSVFPPPQLVRLKESLEELTQDLYEKYPETRDKKLSDLALIDIGIHLTNLNKLDEAMKVSQRVLKIFPTLAHVRQSMSVLLMLQGKLDKAIDYTQESVSQYPNDTIAPYLLSQFHYLIGNSETAQELCLEIMSDPPVDVAEYSQRFQLLAILDQADDILKTYELFLRDHKQGDLTPDTLHFVATAMALKGEIKKAKALWTEIKPNSSLIVSQNLEDIDLPISQQNGIAYFELEFLVPPIWIDLVSQPAKNNAQMKRRIDKLFKDAPWFENLIRFLFLRGDSESREFALFICGHHPLPILHDFAIGTKGTDAHRLRALFLLMRHEMISQDSLPEILMNGEWQIPELFKYKITYESTPDDLPKHIQRKIERCHELVSARDWYAALDLIEDTRELVPDSRALMNFEITVLKAIDEKDEAELLLEELIEKHPNYLFARMDKARSLIEQKKYDEVGQWIEPIESRSEFHYSELRAYAITKIEWFIAQKENDMALDWLHQLEAIFPESADDFQTYHRRLSVNRLLSSVPLFGRFFNR